MTTAEAKPFETTTLLDGQDTRPGQPLTADSQQVEQTMPGHEYGRNNMRAWVALREANAYTRNTGLQHTLRFHLGQKYATFHDQYEALGAQVSTTLDQAVTENDLRFNLPRIDPYNHIGDRVDKIVHHPSYTIAGDIIYGTNMVKLMATAGSLTEGMGFYALGHHVGEAGHFCPVICNYETARVLKLMDDFPQKEAYIQKLETPSYTRNYTSSQFLTEVQGGSDVGANDTRAWQNEKGEWFIRGEKWFCSNANAELMVISARRSLARKGTKGLSMFLIPATKPDGTRNHFTMRRLKEKLGTRALASAEIDYHDAYAIPLGENFNFMLEKVIHHSRIALPTADIGLVTRAFQLSFDFAKTRHAFGKNIVQYPLVKENLAKVKCDVMAAQAGTFYLIAKQDQLDTQVAPPSPSVAFSRLMVNIGKSVISKRTVHNIHLCLDGIGGNGAIEYTSSLPRLLRDAIILENWEGTHNTLYMQVLRDIHRYQHDEIYLTVMSDRIGSLHSDLAHQQQLAVESLNTLKGLIDDFHQASSDLQTLKIQDVVTHMANLFYFVCLVEEGRHQLLQDGVSNKLDCAELFFKLHLLPAPLVRDEAYLTLCDSALASGM